MHRHPAAGAGSIELDEAVLQGVEGVVLADADVDARLEARPALPDQDRPGGDLLAAELLHAQTLRLAVAAVARTANSLFVCHPLPTLPWFRSRAQPRPGRWVRRLQPDRA